jgi:hypothetical protein
MFLAALWLVGSAAVYANTNSSLLSDDQGPGQMTIDILPGNSENIINLSRQRVIAVAIMGSASLDINDVNPRTLKLKALKQNLVGKSDKNLCRQQDVNGDSYKDLVCDIKTIGFRVEPGDITVVISAGTYGGESLRAEGVLKYVRED